MKDDQGSLLLPWLSSDKWSMKINQSTRHTFILSVFFNDFCSSASTISATKESASCNGQHFKFSKLITRSWIYSPAASLETFYDAWPSFDEDSDLRQCLWAFVCRPCLALTGEILWGWGRSQVVARLGFIILLDTQWKSFAINEHWTAYNNDRLGKLKLQGFYTWDTHSDSRF